MKNGPSKEMKMKIQKAGVHMPPLPAGVPSNPNPRNDAFKKINLGATKIAHPFLKSKHSI